MGVGFLWCVKDGLGLNLNFFDWGFNGNFDRAVRLRVSMDGG